jgi:N-acetylglucosamine-6-phosphate deacetylase
MLLTGGHIFTPSEEFWPGEILIRGGQILAVGEDLSAQTPPDAERLDVSGLFVTPGFIDLHTQGAGGHDVWDGTTEALAGWSLAKAREGATAFMVTTGYRDEGFDFLLKHLDHAEKFFPGARPLGVYLESPFCSIERRGGILKERVLPVSIELLDEIHRRLGDKLRMMTVAPEREHALELIADLARRGIVPALGHTDCDYSTALLAIEAGVTHVTHCFNTMRSMHHRTPGPLAAVLLDGRVDVELITDGIHIHPAVVDLTVRLKGEGLVSVVTDSMRAAGLPDGEYTFGREGRTYRVEEGAVKLPDGTLAGSTLTMIRALKNTVKFSGLPLRKTLPMLTSTPARAVRVNGRKGELKPGFDADITVFHEDYTVHQTIVAGKTVYLHDSAKSL